MTAPDYLMVRAGAQTCSHPPTLRALFEEVGRIFPDVLIGKKPETWLSGRVVANIETEINEQKAVVAKRACVRQDFGRRGPPRGFVKHPFHDSRHLRVNTGVYMLLRRAPGMVWLRLSNYVRPGGKPPDGTVKEIILTVRLGGSAANLDHAYGMEPVITIDSTHAHFTYKRKPLWTEGTVKETRTVS